jgi:NADPH:quinone reductase-like Zn-dependent oxidoreductase
LPRAIQFDHYGGRDVLHVADVELPVAAAGEVVVEVRAAGINIGEAATRSGALAARFPATFPSGEGSVAGSTTDVLTELAALVASNQIEIPIAAVYPLEQVREAFAELEERHTHGKIVLIPGAASRA